MINENSLWIDDKTEKSFKKSPTKISNAFWINFLGFCALYDINKDYELLKQYFNQKVQIRNVTDDSNDLFLIIKILVDSKRLENSVASKITKLFARLKTRKDDKINQILLRNLLKQIKISKIPVSAKIKPTIKDFLMGTSSLNDILDTLYTFAFNKKIATEFTTIARKMKTNLNDIDQQNNQKTVIKKTVVKKTVTTKAIDSVSGTPDFYNKMLDTLPFDKNFPFKKNNKDLVKLFLLKIINMKNFMKITPKRKNILVQLKKNNTSVKEIKKIISEDDFKDMYENKFPSNHPQLKKLIGNNIFRPIDDLFFDSLFGDEFNSVFKYKFIIKRNFLLKKNFSINDLYPFEKWSKDDLKDVEDSINLRLIKYLNDEMFNFLLTNLKTFNTKFSDYLSGLIYSSNLYLFTNVRKKQMLDIIDDMQINHKWNIEWIKKWYMSTSEKNKEKFKSMVFMYKLQDFFTFVDLKASNINDYMYYSFIDYLLSGGTIYTDTFDLLNYKKWLENINKTEQFSKEFEDPKYDDFFKNYNARYGITYNLNDAFDKLDIFILNRKRKFTFNVKNDIIKNFILGYSMFADQIYFKKIRKEIINYILNNNIQLGNYIYSQTNNLENIIYKEDWLPFWKIQKITSIYFQYIDFSVLDIDFVKNNINEIIDIFSKNVILDKIYKRLYDEFHYLFFTFDTLKTRYTLSDKMYQRIILNNKYKEPMDVWIKCEQYITGQLKNGDQNDLLNFITNSHNLSDDENNELVKYLKKNFKEKIINDENAISKISRLKGWIFLNKLFDNEDELLKSALLKPYYLNSIKPTNTAELLNLFNKPENLLKIMENGKDALTALSRKNNANILLNSLNYNDLIKNKIDILSDEQFDKFILYLFNPKKPTTYLKNIINTYLYSSTITEIYNSKDALIQPNEKLDKKRINQILKFNNVTVKLPKELKKQRKETQKHYLKRIEKDHKFIKTLEPLKITEIKESEEELEQKTVEYLKYYNNNHGNSAIEFLKSFDVNMISKELTEWLKDHKTPNIIPAFHGTGSVGASMILRYGFKILNSTDPSIAGRMLGDGIYISNIIEKSAQYIGDSGFSRRLDTIGYILECEAYIGEENKNYKSAGLAGIKSYIRSPEWVIFNPRAQLKIVKAHKVKMTTKNYVNSLKNKYKNVQEKYFKNYSKFYNNIMNSNDTNISNNKLSNMLLENNNNLNSIDYIFYDGFVLTTDSKIIKFEDFTEKYKNYKNIAVSPGQLGPVVTIKTKADVIGSVHIPSTNIFKNDNPDNLYDQYITILTNAIENYNF